MTLFKEDTQLVKTSLPWGPLQNNFTIFTESSNSYETLSAYSLLRYIQYKKQFEFKITMYMYAAPHMP